MLTNATACPTIGVKDLATAKDFYEKKLGLEPIGESNDQVQLFKSGDTTIEVYKSEFAGTNKATALTFGLGDELDKEVKTLRDKGVEFEHYNMPGTKLEGDIHVMEGMKAAWFKDPDGNILCLHDH